MLGARGVGLIQRTTATSWVKVPAGFLPGMWGRCAGRWAGVFGRFPEDGDLRIGPIPKGTPVSLMGNFDT